MSFPKIHVFICTNSPETPGKCGHLNSGKLHQGVKDAAKEIYGADVRINKAGCLGQCEQGIACVIYPQNKWILNLKADDQNKVLDAIKDIQFKA